jgi:uncharacterized protein DUF6247
MSISPAAGQPDGLACTPSAIRAVLAAHAGPEVVQQFDQEVDAAFEQAERDRDLTPFVQTIRRWWLEARAGRRGSQAFLATPPRAATSSGPD